MSGAKTISAVILAGGQSRRMGGIDKGLIDLNGKPLVQHLIDRIAPQVDEVLISANRHAAEYQQLGYPVLGDEQQDFLGPLAGIASAMEVCQHPLLLVVPCDTPFLPDNLVQTMALQLSNENSDICLAHDGRRLQPLISLLKTTLLPDLKRNIAANKLKVTRWMMEQNHSIAQFHNPAAFCNINTPEELATAADKRD